MKIVDRYMGIWVTHKEIKEILGFEPPSQEPMFMLGGKVLGKGRSASGSCWRRSRPACLPRTCSRTCRRKSRDASSAGIMSGPRRSSRRNRTCSSRSGSSPTPPERRARISRPLALHQGLERMD